MMTVERIVMVVAGFMVLLSTALGYWHNQYWFLLTVFVGFNLFQAGFTNFCPLAIILKKLGVSTEAEKGTCTTTAGA